MIVSLNTEKVEGILAALPPNSRKRPGLELILQLAVKASLREKSDEQIMREYEDSFFPKREER